MERNDISRKSEFDPHTNFTKTTYIKERNVIRLIPFYSETRTRSKVGVGVQFAQTR